MIIFFLEEFITRIVVSFYILYHFIREVGITLFVILLALFHTPLHTPWFLLHLLERPLVYFAGLISLWVTNEESNTTDTILAFSWALKQIDKDSEPNNE